MEEQTGGRKDGKEGRKEGRNISCAFAAGRIDAIDARSRIIEALDRGQRSREARLDDSVRYAKVEIELKSNSMEFLINREVLTRTCNFDGNFAAPHRCLSISRASSRAIENRTRSVSRE